MSLWLEREAGQYTKAKDKVKAALARNLVASSQAWREAGYEELPLPAQEKGEKLVEIQRFSPEAKAAFEQAGFVIHELTGQSIKSLREAGNRFRSDWHNQYPEFEGVKSMRSEVAINPNQLFLPDSNIKTYDEQKAMVEDFSAKIGKSVPGVIAVIGEASDYADLVFSHLKATDNQEYLFGEKYNFNYTRTKTAFGQSVAYFGYFDPDDGPYVNYWNPGDRNGILFVAPLVVPSGNLE